MPWPETGVLSGCLSDSRDSRSQGFVKKLDMAPGPRRGLNSEAPLRAFVFVLQAPFDFLRLLRLH